MQFNNIGFLNNNEFKVCHCPHIIKHPHHNILFMTFYGGIPEGTDGCSIWMTTCTFQSDNDIYQWEQAWQIAYDPTKCFQNPIIFMQNDILYLFYTSQPGNGIDICQADSHIEQKISTDLGKTWSSPKIVIPKGEGCYIRHGILIDKSNPNIWLMPVYYTPSPDLTNYDQHSALLESNDCGINWKIRSVIPGSENSNGIQGCFDYIGNNIIAIFRNRHYNQIKISISQDNGYAFTPLQIIDSELMSNNSGISISIINERQLMLFYNDTEGQIKDRRNNITTCIISIDWENIKNIKVENKKVLINNEILNLEKSQRISYPTSLKVNDRIHCCFAFRRKTIGHVIVKLLNNLSN